MNITYKLTQDEYQQAVNLHHKKTQRMIFLAVYVMVAAIIVAVGTDFSNTREVITNMLAAFFSIAFYMLFVRMISTYQAKSIYQKSTVLPYETTLHISGKGITLHKEGDKPSIPWSVFSKWKKNDHFYLIYTSPRQFNIIPTRVMNDSQKKELDAYLEKYITQN